MRIELDDHTVHMERIQQMMDYFDILDRAGVQDEPLDAAEMAITDLREDRHVPFGGNLIGQLKNYKGRHVRAPKMV